MEQVALLRTLLAGIIYPVWLIAGALDWWCHRRSRIETTSGATESWLHVAQFLSLAAFLLLATTLPFNAISAAFVIATVLAHAALSYSDVNYTLSRRHISALEQHVHGFLDVLPWVACALWIVMNLSTYPGGQNSWRMSPQGTLTLLVSYAVLAGVPVAIELFRTLRSDSSAP
jgi:hypothetical protein